MAQCRGSKKSGIIGFGRRCPKQATRDDGLCNGHRAVRARQQRQDAYWKAENERFAREHPNPPCRVCAPDRPDAIGLCRPHYEAALTR